MKHFLAVFKARNTEFFRDRASLSWNLAFPILLIVGFAVMFGEGSRALYKVGVIGDAENSVIFSDFKTMEYLELVEYQDVEKAKQKLRQHSLDMLIDESNGDYWVNQDAPKGYIIEKVMLSMVSNPVQQQTVEGKAIRYVDWALPGILGMNMMFSCLFGVGYVIVRYRKNGVLKRLKATPLSAMSFLSAQVASRLFVVFAISSFLFVSMDVIFDFPMLGSWLALVLVAIAGAMSMIALGLMMASQTKSEELAGGLLNLVTWPMMLLSGVWFSLEGAPEIMQQISYVFPLTHMLEAARAVMLDGAGLWEVSVSLLVLLAMTFAFLLLGAWRFEWGE